MSNPTSNFNWQMPTSTDLVTDLPADFEVFGQAVDTSLADLRGGTTNQILAKNSNADMDFKWVADAAGMTNPMTTTGDTIYSSSGSTPARLGIGTTGQVLSVSGGIPAWTTPAGPATLNLSQVATGTVSGTEFSITGLGGYDTIMVLVEGVVNASGDQTYNFRTNTTAVGVQATNNVYGNRRNSVFSTVIPDPADYSTGYGSGRIYMARWGYKYNSANNLTGVILTNCKAAGFTTFRAFANYIYDDEGTNRASYGTSDGIIKNAAQVTSVQFAAGVGYSMTGGTYYVYAG